jgi:voltage-gated potassium channel
MTCDHPRGAEDDGMRSSHRVAAHLTRREMTARRAGRAIALTTLVITIAGGLLVRVTDPEDFPTVGRGMWWAVQTVTTVGYGDVVPHHTSGRAVGTVLMLNGIALLSVITAAITATLIEQARRRRPAGDESVLAAVKRIESRLDAMDASPRAPRRED